MPRIKGIRRIDDTTIRFGGNGDNWHMSWANDDKQYVSLCDGYGLPGTPKGSYNSRAYAIIGDPPMLRFEFLPGYPELASKWNTPECSRYVTVRPTTPTDARFFLNMRGESCDRAQASVRPASRHRAAVRELVSDSWPLVGGGRRRTSRRKVRLSHACRWR